MGNSAQTDGYFYFKTPEDASRALNKIEKWIDNANTNKLPKHLQGDYNIQYPKQQGCSIEFHAESCRKENLWWQMENMKNDLVTSLEGVLEFAAPIMVFWDDVSWNIEELRLSDK